MLRSGSFTTTPAALLFSLLTATEWALMPLSQLWSCTHGRDRLAQESLQTLLQVSGCLHTECLHLVLIGCGLQWSLWLSTCLRLSKSLTAICIHQLTWRGLCLLSSLTRNCPLFGTGTTIFTSLHSDSIMHFIKNQEAWLCDLEMGEELCSELSSNLSFSVSCWAKRGADCSCPTAVHWYFCLG